MFNFSEYVRLDTRSSISTNLWELFTPDWTVQVSKLKKISNSYSSSLFFSNGISGHLQCIFDKTDESKFCSKSKIVVFILCCRKIFRTNFFSAHVECCFANLSGLSDAQPQKPWNKPTKKN